MAGIPGLSMHATAHALATFYAALGAGQLVGSSVLSQAPHLSAAGNMRGVRGRWGLGLQIGECVESQGQRRHLALGHAASGGSVGLCVPQAGLALAITVSKLSRSRLASSKLTELLLLEYGMKLSGFFE